MDTIQLDVLGKKVYRAQKLSFANGLKSAEMLAQPSAFSMAIKTADGNYHSVYSEISDVVKKDKDLIAKGKVAVVVTDLMKEDESMHGQRFVIFHPERSEKAYLLGDVATALKKLSNN